MKECILLIITESEFRAVQETKKNRRNIAIDNEGTHRNNKKYTTNNKS